MTLPDMRQVLDRIAIRDRVDLYVDRLNHRDWNDYGDLFTEDAVWTCNRPTDARIEGRQAMVDMVSTVQQYQHGFVFQMNHGLVITDLTATTARSRHTLHIMSDRFTMIGIYYDRLVKEADDVWRFQRRDYQVTYHDTTPLTGEIFRRLPDPQFETYPV